MERHGRMDLNSAAKIKPKYAGNSTFWNFEHFSTVLYYSSHVFFRPKNVTEIFEPGPRAKYLIFRDEFKFDFQIKHE